MNITTTAKIWFATVVLSLLLSSCCGFIKAEDLGHNFVLSEYDEVDRRILYTEDQCSGDGIEAVPMTVLEYAKNSKWIIAKSAESEVTTNLKYWVIDKDFEIAQSDDNISNVVKSHIYGPFDSTTFLSKLHNLNINLKLKKI